MRPDPNYIKKLLTAFQDAPGPTVKFSDLTERSFPGEVAELYFHLRLLNDQGFVRREDDEPGIDITHRSDGNFEWPEATQLRLTASGHEFADALNNSRALETVKKAMVGSVAIMKEIGLVVLKDELRKHGYL
jgi:hypothetical protein